MAAADKKRDVIMVHASKIRLEKRVYPRIKPSDENIKRYTELVKAGAKFPPILLDQNYRLMDGFHRWQAHINANKYEIPARIVRIPDDIRGFEIACQMNAIQGMPLTKEERAEKRQAALPDVQGKERLCLHEGHGKNSQGSGCGHEDRVSVAKELHQGRKGRGYPEGPGTETPGQILERSGERNRIEQK